MSGSQYLSIRVRGRPTTGSAPPFVVEQSCIPCVPRIFACTVGPVYQFFLIRNPLLDFGSLRIRLYGTRSAVGGQTSLLNWLQAQNLREQFSLVFGEVSKWNPSVRARPLSRFARWNPIPQCPLSSRKLPRYICASLICVPFMVLITSTFR